MDWVAGISDDNGIPAKTNRDLGGAKRRSERERNLRGSGFALTRDFLLSASMALSPSVQSSNTGSGKDEREDQRGNEEMRSRGGWGSERAFN